MTRRANIYKRGGLAATIEETSEGYVRFAYNKEWQTKQKDWLSLTLPFSHHQQPTQTRSLPPFFDGLIPEGWLLTVAQRLRPDLGKDRFGLMLASCGDAVGDVSVVSDDQAVPTFREEVSPISSDRRKNGTGRCLVCARVLSDGKHYHPSCAQTLFGTHDASLPFSQEQFEEIAAANIRARLIVAGAQRKISTSLARDAQQDCGRITLVGAGNEGLFIVKPEHPEAPTFPANEHLAMSLARATGLPTAEFGLMIGPDSKFAYVTRRFDRVWGGLSKQVTKRAMEDFGQLFDRVRDNDKYKGSYEQIGRFLREQSPRALVDCAHFFDQVFLAYLIGNNDFHVRNLSVFVEGNRPTLTPVYDFTITQLIDSEPEVDSTLSVNGKKAKLTREDWIAFGEKLGLVPKAVAAKLARFEKLMPAFAEVIQNSFLPAVDQKRLIIFMQGRMGRVLT